LENLPKKGQLHYRAKFFPVSKLPQPGSDFLENLRKKPYDLSAFYNLLFFQEASGSFLPSDGLANLFGLQSGRELVKIFKDESDNERVQKMSDAVCVTSMVIWFLKLLLKDYQNEWSGVYDRAERYVGNTAKDLELEELIIIAGARAVSKQFNISLDQSLYQIHTFCGRSYPSEIQIIYSTLFPRSLFFYSRFFNGKTIPQDCKGYPCPPYLAVPK
jgi:hypothetical protein